MLPKLESMVSHRKRQVEIASVLMGLVGLSVAGCASEPPLLAQSTPAAAAMGPPRAAAPARETRGGLSESGPSETRSSEHTSSDAWPLETLSTGARPTITPVSNPAPVQQAPDLAALVAEVIEEHNRIRAEAGLNALKPNAELEAAAKAHADDMAARAKMSHIGADGSSPKDRIDRTGYQYQTVAENVAYGQRKAQVVMDMWMDSPGHKKNIVGDFSEVGVACAVDKEGLIYYSAEFGKPWPKVDPAKGLERLIEIHNQERAKAGLGKLKLSPILTTVAKGEAREMAEQGTLKPKPTSGKTVFERIDRTRGRFGAISANGSTGIPTPEEVMHAWMEAPAHKATILGDFAFIGAGYATGKNGTPYWYVLFAQPARR
jgi:uncharacterized protein YkwD